MRHAIAAVLAVVLVLIEGMSARAHQFGTNPPTWNREVSRLVYDRCAGCHREGGTAFSMITYQDVQPRAVAIKDAVLSRRMPPWGAVKGFGEFKNDAGLTQEQIELVSDWLEGGMLKGNNPNVKPELPKFEAKPAPAVPAGGLVVRGVTTLRHAMTVEGVLPVRVPSKTSAQITATFPNGRIEPLVWLYEYRETFGHPFLFRTPIALPEGTVIRGIPATGAIKLLGGSS